MFRFARRSAGRLMLMAISLLTLLSLLVSPAASAAPACKITPVSKGMAVDPVITADGRYITYQAGVEIADIGPSPQVLLYTRATKATRVVSLSHQGEILYNDDAYTSQQDISDNGRVVAFFSNARNLAEGFDRVSYQIYVRDLASRTTELASQANGVAANQASWEPALSADGRYVVFETDADNLVPGDTNGDMDVYLRDRKLGITERISVASDGSQDSNSFEFGYSNVDISANGRYVVFNAQQLKGNDGVVHNGIFLRDRKAQKTYFIVNGYRPAMTPDARFIVFSTEAKLVSKDRNTFNDLYIYDRKTKKFELISAGPNGRSEINTVYSFSIASLSADGRWVAFSTNNPKLVKGDKNGVSDVFLRDRSNGKTLLLSVNAKGKQGNNNSLNPSISADGRLITFFSRATNLVASVTQPGFVYLCKR